MMTEMALTVRGLCKAYPRFRLEDVSLNVPRGTVVGLIGENGAGKSTLISAALGLVKRDAGAVSVLGKETLDAETLGQVGVVFDGNNFPDVLSPAKLGRVFRRIYPSWDEPGYAALLERLGVPPDQKLSEMSKGTRTKLSIVDGAFARVPAAGAGRTDQRAGPGGERRYSGPADGTSCRTSKTPC